MPSKHRPRSIGYYLTRYRRELKDARERARTGRLDTDRVAGRVKAQLLERVIREIVEGRELMERRHEDERARLARRVTQAVEGEK